ncbi:MAG: DUF2157 domain-containing protein [Acidimicrobiia bacterium]|nr:DUF2157 domain-containing protein [Acidimicrobiia bacterium]MDH3398330.1 DUF2157 domain-containing protein [Acidimicrobiia bacterium]
MKDLNTSLREWVATGLIDETQAQAIRAHEATPTVERRVPLVAEVLGYLGGSLALIAAFILVGEFWADLQSWARLLLVGAGTIAFLAAGWFIKSIDNEAIHRLSSFSWALGTVGVAFWFGLLANDVLDSEPETTALIAAVAGLLVGYAVYRLSPRSLQQILLGGAAVATPLSLLAHIDQPPDEFYGLVVWGIGVSWLLLAWGRHLPPQSTAYALGSVGVLLGPQVMRFNEATWPMLLGLVTAGVLLTFSVTLRNTVLLGFGAAGIFIFVPQIIFEYFGDTVGVPLALFLTGVVLLGGALLVARLRTEVVSGPSAEELS